MKKYIVSTLTLVAVLGGSISPAFADNGSGIRGFFQKFQQGRQDDRRDDAESKSVALRLKHEADRQERITKFWRKTGERLQRLIDLETKMADKIGKRLQKLEDAGKNVSSQKALLATARLKITDAQTALTSASADTQLKALIEQNKPTSEIMARVRVLHKNVLAAIREAHKALVAVVVSTRGMSAPTPTP